MPNTLALVGCGSRGLRAYGAYAEEHPDKCRVVAAAEPREWYREEARRRHPHLQHVFADWRELAAQPKLADAVIIATQDSEHIEPCLAFAQLGYDILLEKPMATTEEGCRQIAEAVRRHNVLLFVAHVLRYTAYFRELKKLVAEVGQVATVRHFEPVNFWHQAHSFVRGNWRRADTSSPMILAKSCHDMDILLYLLGKHCTQLASFGHRSHFRPERRPPGAADRCLDCAVPCPYNARDFYLGMVERNELWWPVDVLTPDLTVDGVTRALREGPYGRCVYACDNDVVDHQVVALEFEEGISATFTMTAFTENRWRETEILGSHGQLLGNGEVLRLTRFLDRSVQEWDLSAASHDDGHGGGDAGLMDDFLAALQDRESALREPHPEEALESHLMAFAAERARVESRVVRMR